MNKIKLLIAINIFLMLLVLLLSWTNYQQKKTIEDGSGYCNMITSSFLGLCNNLEKSGSTFGCSLEAKNLLDKILKD